LGAGLARGRAYSGKLAASPGTLLATPPGLVYRAEAVPGFWFIPWSDVLPRVEAEFTKLAAVRAARPAPGNHRGRQLLHTYDLDQDGKVTGGEFAGLFSGEKLDADANASRMLSMHFNNADKNRDGGLDGNELSAVGDLIRARSVPSSVQLPPRIGFGGPPTGPGQPRLPGQPFRPQSPFTQQSDLKQFDKNQDGRIDEEEAKALQQHLQAQQARPLQQLPQGPPPPEILERYDKNKNGKMDPDEMQEFMREMMSGKSPRPRGTNAPAAVPVPKTPPGKP
ncbi:MAG: EF-hand domain-containing protein, partial [Limisphaerales bacterium]